MRRFACLSFCCLLPLCVHGQGVKKDAKATTAKNGSAASVAPAKAALFDNVIAVFREVQASGLAGAKGEFESTAQYEARLASWKSKGATKKYVFVIENNGQTDDFANYTFKYDADAEAMHLTVGSKYDDSDSLQLRSIRTVLGTYVGVNAFGVKKLITREAEETYYLKVAVAHLKAAVSRHSPLSDRMS
jgi:hypothetical protein